MIIMPRMAHWDVVDLSLVLAMWAVMMAAMMLPSAWPAVRAVARITLLSKRRDDLGLSFAAGYLAVWVAFSIAATFLHWALLEAALVTPMMESGSSALSGVLLIV